VQRQHADLVVLAPVAGELALAREEDEVVGRVPLLDDVEPFVDLVPELPWCTDQEHGRNDPTPQGCSVLLPGGW